MASTALLVNRRGVAYGRALVAALSTLGYDSVEVCNMTRPDLVAAIERTKAKLIVVAADDQALQLTATAVASSGDVCVLVDGAPASRVVLNSMKTAAATDRGLLIFCPSDLHSTQLHLIEGAMTAGTIGQPLRLTLSNLFYNKNIQPGQLMQRLAAELAIAKRLFGKLVAVAAMARQHLVPGHIDCLNVTGTVPAVHGQVSCAIDISSLYVKGTRTIAVAGTEGLVECRAGAVSIYDNPPAAVDAEVDVYNWHAHHNDNYQRNQLLGWLTAINNHHQFGAIMPYSIGWWIDVFESIAAIVGLLEQAD